ncbi:carbohydrate ABC transporter substrate-binding protein, CUT1 family [Lentzea waywayandensis]|uniref:Carbohydrate ABC transporter substrate-binding protein, CUT1 family n=1 Tax=Lentzea waywayandensis TaxID=84724 RepID=A0A1I6F7R1_9PSEU|nr:extracellular solute-binding protein [Lentzea waywayandensis]SFR25807.1 carbohydrate ABC transporter substrate-binding protein, CUT1 family [Lentzea waywayandensis]
MITRRSLLAAAGLTLLTGCSSSTKDPNGPLKFWSSLRGTNTVVDAWNAKNPREPVVLETVTSGFAGGNAKLSNAARAGNAPDVVSMADADLPMFALDGVATDMTDLVSAQLRAELGEVAWSGATFGGRVYGVPLDLPPLLMLYREDILREHGVDVPTTWDEFREAARALKARNIYLTAFHPNGYNLFAAHVMQTGGRWFGVDGDSWVVNFTDAGSLKAAEYWQGLLDEQLLFLAPGSSQEWLAALAEGRVASHLVSTWGVAALASSVPGGAGKWRIAAAPQWDLAKPSIGRDGASLHVITAESVKKERAMRFIEWMSTSPEAITARLSSGRSSLLPAAPKLWDAAAKQFKTTFYGGQDLYGLAAKQYELQHGGWMWGPRMQSTATSIHHGLARIPYGTTIAQALRDAEAETLPDMRSLGLSVRRS